MHQNNLSGCTKAQGIYVDTDLGSKWGVSMCGCAYL